MRVTEPSRSGRRDLTAALLWDVEVLSRSKSKGAQMFARAMNLLIPEVPKEPEGKDALVDAVCGLAMEFDGNRDGARQVYERIAKGGYGDGLDSLTRLLGLALLAWSDPPEVSRVISLAEKTLGKIRNPVLKAMYRAKLSVFATNSGNPELALQLLKRACEAAPESQPILKWRLHFELARAQGNNRFEQRPNGYDQQYEFSSIRLLAGSSARKALVEAVQENAKSPWTRTLHFGSTSSDTSAIAVMQAEWAGASWMLDDLRLQAASHLFILGGKSSEEWVNAAAQWSIGGGSQLSRVLDYAERRFNQNSFNDFFSKILRKGDRLKSKDRLVEILLEFWDLLSEQDAIDILDRFKPVGSAWSAEKIRALWGVLAALVPGPWAERFSELESRDQIALLQHMPVGVIKKLTVETRATLAQRWFDQFESESKDLKDVPWATAAVLAFNEHRPEFRRQLVEMMKSAPALDRILMVGLIPELKDELELQRAVVEVWDTVHTIAETARSGTVSFGGVSPILRLAIGLSHLKPTNSTKRIVNGLVKLAQDNSLFAEIRSDVLIALLRLARTHGPDINAASLRNLTPSNVSADFDASEDEFVTNLGCLVAINSDFADDSPEKLFALCRNADPRVRQMAVEVAGDILLINDDRLLEGTILSSLFDPAHTVVCAGLKVIEQMANRIVWTRDPFVDRAKDLYESENRMIRIGVYRAVDAIEKSGEHDVRLTEILELAKHDRSFRVRQAVLN